MQISPPDITPTLNTQISTSRSRHARATHFSELIAPRDGATDRAPQSDQAQVRTAAEDLVAITLIRPLLEQARRDPFRTDLFHGGFAEDTFGAQMDWIVAQRITQAARLPIVDAVYQRLTPAGNKVNTHG